MAGVGDNSIAKDQLRAFVERIERLEEEKRAIAEDIKEVYAEAKGNGFDTKTMRKVVALRKMDAAERQEQEAILDLYLEALGMLAGTPLGQAAVARDAKTDRRLRKAVEGLGTAVPLTEEERAKGVAAAFEKGGTRTSIQFGDAPMNRATGVPEEEPPAELDRRGVAAERG